MKVFIGCNIIQGNPLIRQLVNAYQLDDRIDDLSYGVDAFWQKPGFADVLHFHWPEILFNWDEPDTDGIKRLQLQLDLWRKQAVLVATIHDRFPHYRDTRNFRLLFDTVYQCCDGFIHMGEVSVKDFVKRYPYTKKRLHKIIPHPVNDYFPNNIDRSQALNKFKISPDHVIYLSFGALRDQEESNLLINGFRALNLLNKYLIIAGPWLDIADDLQKIIKNDNKIIVIQSFIPDDEVQFYLNAANVLIIPRVRNLNSGNLALGFSFGKVVVGPTIGTIGEILYKTQNPVFDPGDLVSFVDSLLAAKLLHESGKGILNQAYANLNWGVEYVKDCHIDFYQELIINKSTELHKIDLRE